MLFVLPVKEGAHHMSSAGIAGKGNSTMQKLVSVIHDMCFRSYVGPFGTVSVSRKHQECKGGNLIVSMLLPKKYSETSIKRHL